MSLNRRQFMVHSAGAAALAASLEAAARQKARVGLVPSNHGKLSKPLPLEDPLDYETVREMVWRAIEYGRPRAGSLEGSIKPGAWVVIKPNIAFLQAQRSYAPGDIADMRVTQAVLEYVARKSKARRITIAEGGSYRGLKDPNPEDAVMQNGARADATNFVWDPGEFPGWSGSVGGMLQRFASAFPDKQFDYADLGYDAVKDAAGRPARIEVPRSPGGVGAFGERTDYFMSRTVRDCDYLISVPVLKVHVGTGITCSLKNYVGAAPREAYAVPGHWTNALLHRQHSLEGRIDSFVCDLAAFHPPDYSVVDGIRGLQYDVHNIGRPDQTVRSNLVLAGEDPVAVDAIAGYVAGFNTWDLEYLHMAAARGMGTREMDGIDVIGAEPDRHRRTWAKPDRSSFPWHGRFNREWRISADASAPLAGWKRHTNRTDTVNLVSVAGVPPAAGAKYGAAVRVIAGGSSKAVLWLGVRGRVTVELNGQTVLEQANPTRYRAGQFKQPVELRSGENLLVCRVEPIREEALLSVLLVGPRNDGDTVEGIQWRA